MSTLQDFWNWLRRRTVVGKVPISATVKVAVNP